MTQMKQYPKLVHVLKSLFCFIERIPLHVNDVQPIKKKHGVYSVVELMLTKIHNKHHDFDFFWNS